MKTILVVEDESSNLFAFRAALENEGYRVLGARDGDEAVRICRQESAAIDLVVLDVLLPHANGFEVARRVVETCPVPVLFVSGTPLQALVRQGYVDPLSGQLAGAFFLEKPFLPETLCRKIRTILETITTHAY